MTKAERLFELTLLLRSRRTAIIRFRQATTPSPPYLTVAGAADLIECLKQAFAAREKECITQPDGTIGHGACQPVLGRPHGHGERSLRQYLKSKYKSTPLLPCPRVVALSMIENAVRFLNESAKNKTTVAKLPE